MTGKIKDVENLAGITSGSPPKRIGLVAGCFDILHYGHIRLIEFAKERCDLLLVGVESDQAISLNKGVDRPIFSTDIRMKVIAALSAVDFVFAFEHTGKYGSPDVEKYYQDVYRQLGITHLFTHMQKDSSYDRKSRRVKPLGIEIVIQDEEPTSSSTEIIQRLFA